MPKAWLTMLRKKTVVRANCRSRIIMLDSPAMKKRRVGREALRLCRHTGCSR